MTPSLHRLCAPSFVPLMAILLATLFAAPFACAGTYTWTTTDANGNITAQSPSFSGGIVNVVTTLHAPGKPNTRPPLPFSTSNGHYTGSGGCDSNSVRSYGAPGSVKDNSPAKPIVATFTWQPAQGQTSTTDPPPPAVIVQQNCTASVSWSTWQTGTATGSADCALPGASISYSTDSSGATTGMTSSGTLYSSVSSPGASFSIPAQSAGAYQPTASASATCGSSGQASASTNIDYQVQAFPVFVIPGGTYNPSQQDYRVLTGQQISATLNGIPSGFTVTSYTWAINPSATCFKTYNEVAPSNQLVALGSTDLSGPAAGSTTVAALNFYDRVKEDLTATCTVTITAPDNKTILNVTATSPTINVLKPTASWGVDPKTVPANGTANSNQIGFHDDSATSQSYGVNTTWYPATLSVPSPFS